MLHLTIPTLVFFPRTESG